ncbi:Contactin-2 [Galemys pyrenaicus]|uniref:Axonal glycoprotein TAG-1 n=1 Tax=Galemys pyrenaicus TaxID=202257 RepID=A0A8J6AIY4_GALPY|nr:Contactin-2 [Galemys pyrenaicus]
MAAWTLRGADVLSLCIPRFLVMMTRDGAKTAMAEEAERPETTRGLPGARPTREERSRGGPEKQEEFNLACVSPARGPGPRAAGERGPECPSLSPTSAPAMGTPAWSKCHLLLLLLTAALVSSPAQSSARGALATFGPVFEDQPLSLLFPEESTEEKVTLACRARASPPATYRWKMNGTEMTLEPGSRHQLVGGNLVIMKPTKAQDAGVYQCLASNPVGTVVSREAVLRFGFLQEFSKEERDPVKTHEGWGVMLPCNPPAHYPGLSYRWLLNEFPNFIPTDGRHFVSQTTGNLYIARTNASDLGNYSCLATSHMDFSTKSVFSKFAQLNLAAEDTRLLAPNIKARLPAETYALVGQRVTLECFAFGKTARAAHEAQGEQVPESAQRLPTRSTVPASPPARPGRAEDASLGAHEPGTYGQRGGGLPSSARPFRVSPDSPVPRIKWRKVDGSLSPQWTTAEPTLQIPSVSFEDEGTYECEAENAKGRDTAQGRIIVQAQPEWLKVISDTEADIGSNLRWGCAAAGKPRPTVRWLRNGEPLASQTRVEVLAGDLRFSRLSLEDSGMYQCVAENKHGTIYASAELAVQALAPDFRLSPVRRLIPAARGGKISIPCEPRAAPKAVVLWSKGTEILVNSSRVTVTPEGTLVIRNISRSDEGKYTCFAENFMGKANSTGILSVRDATKITLAPSSADINLGDNLTLQCHASHDPTMDLTFVWTLDDFPIDLDKPGGHYRRASVKETVGDLTILNAQLRHGGKYACVAQTVVDSATKEATVLVRGPPGPPGGVVVRDIGDTTVQLSWSRGFDNHSPIAKYTLQARTPPAGKWRQVRTNPANIEGNAETAQVLGLTPWMDYEFRVSASNILGTGEPSGPSSRIRTKEAAPSVAPSGLSGGGGAPGELVVTWTPVSREYQNGDGFGYLLSFRRQGSAGWQHARVPGADTHYFVYSNDSVRPYTPFEVKIRSYNRRGDGPESLTALVYSAEEEPRVAPTKVWARGVSSSEMNVTWEPVQQDTNGILLGYEVSAAQGPPDQIRYWKAGDKEAAADRVRTAGMDTSARVTGLHPSTKYHVTVRAYNRAGTGPASPSSNATTMKPPPRRPPGNISWTFSSSSLSIKWDPVVPLRNESAVTGYKMLYQHDLHSAPTLHLTSKNWIEVAAPEDIGHALVQIRTTGPGGDGIPAEVHIVRNGGTSMMVENAAVCPALHPGAILFHSVAVLLLIGYLQL